MQLPSFVSKSTSTYNKSFYYNFAIQNKCFDAFDIISEFYLRNGLGPDFLPRSSLFIFRRFSSIFFRLPTTAFPHCAQILTLSVFPIHPNSRLPLKNAFTSIPVEK